MKRLIENEKKKVTIPDLVHKGVRQGNFTLIPNDLLRNPNLSSKAKVLLFIGLSNQDGWKSHKTTISSMMKEGENAIDSAIKELQQFGLMKKIRYRDQQTKQVKGSFWMYTDTPYVFSSFDDILEILDEVGMEIFPADLEGITVDDGSETEENSNPCESHRDGNHRDGNYSNGNMVLKILNKNTKDNKYNIIGPKNEEETNKPTNKNLEFLPLAIKLASIVQSNKNIKIPQSRVNNWADEIRKLSKIEGVAPARIEKALDWYAQNIGGEYIPVIESGSTLRNKFTKLEDAMKRAGKKNQQEGESPKRLIKEHFNGLAPAFEKDCYLPAKELIPGLKGREERAKLTQNLIELYNKIEDAQERHIPKESQHLFPGAMTIINLYIDWIGNNSWIKDKSINLFSMDHLLFNKFRREEARKDNLERDPVTGKSYMKG